MTRRATTIALVFLFSAVAIHAEDWTIKKKIYHNIHVIQVNPDTVSVNYAGGTGRINLADLTPELQAKFKDAAEKAKAFAVIEGEAATDPIAHLVVTLSGSGEMWVNGCFPTVRLPKSAPPEDVALSVMKAYRIKNCKVIRVEQVQIDEDSAYTAVLVRTETSDKIVLIRYIDQGALWWGKVFESGW